MSAADWNAFDLALAARRRAIFERFQECLRVDTVSQQPERVRAGAVWLARAMERVAFETRVLGGRTDDRVAPAGVAVTRGA